MKQTINLSSGETASLMERQFYRLRYDWQAGSEYNGINRPVEPCPAIINFQQLQHNKMNEAWQQFWFGLNRTNDLTSDVRAWNTYTSSLSFLTDGAGTDVYHNYISRKNSGEIDPRIESKGCCGNVICIVGHPITLWDGALHVQIETLDITLPPPFGITYASHPHLIHHATVLTNVNDGHGGLVVNPFSHLGGRKSGVPVYFPVTSNGPVYYPLRYLEKLPSGVAAPNPYNPPMG